MKTIDDVCREYQIHRTTLRRWIRQGFFPSPVQLGPRTLRFREEDLARVGRECLPTGRYGGMESGWIVEEDEDRDDKVDGVPTKRGTFEEIEAHYRQQYPDRGDLLA